MFTYLLLVAVFLRITYAARSKCLIVIYCWNSFLVSMLKMFANLIPVYSSWEVGKLQCFSWIKARFNSPKVRFCVIGDGLEECEAARSMNWPFVKVDFRPNGIHRFPGLDMRTIQSYIDVVYGSPPQVEAESYEGWNLKPNVKLPNPVVLLPLSARCI